MILKKIVLKNFRNYDKQELIFNDKFILYTAIQRTGKTNILEGISYSAFGKKFFMSG
ncbi:MAG: AAA family ATPase [Ignavibacteria bacterium]|nr:AAA family ATPase [Ignavibacteria bacterium]